MAAGKLRDPKTHKEAFNKYMGLLKPLENAGKARFYEFTPRNELYYKVMSLADFVILPSIDETQSGTLARIIALNKPYVTIPVEGLGIQTAEFQGGLLATDEETLADRIYDLIVEPSKREGLSKNSADYLKTRVGWDVVGRLYMHAYEATMNAMKNGGKVIIKRGNPLYEGHF